MAEPGFKRGCSSCCRDLADFLRTCPLTSSFPSTLYFFSRCFRPSLFSASPALEAGQECVGSNRPLKPLSIMDWKESVRKHPSCLAPQREKHWLPDFPHGIKLVSHSDNLHDSTPFAGHLSYPRWCPHSPPGVPGMALQINHWSQTPLQS